MHALTDFDTKRNLHLPGLSELFVNLVVKLPRLISKDLIIKALWLHCPTILGDFTQLCSPLYLTSPLFFHLLFRPRLHDQKSNHDAED